MLEHIQNAMPVCVPLSLGGREKSGTFSGLVWMFAIKKEQKHT
jgi:hypothetical protein